MEATATPYSKGTTAETEPSPEDANGIPKQPRDNNESTLTTTTGTDSTSPETPSHFEGRGNLDTLVAAALKPLAAAEYPRRHHSSPQRYEPPDHSRSTSNDVNNVNSGNNNNNHTCATESSNNNESRNDKNLHSSAPYISLHRGSPSRSPHLVDNNLSAIGDPGLDPSRLHSTTSTVAAEATITTHSKHEHSSSKYHYREQGRTVSDEDSEEDPSPASRQHNRHSHPAASSDYPPQPSHSLQEQSDSAFKSNARSSMSISSLLGDSSGYARRTGDEENSIPDHHATTRHLTPSPVRPSGAQSEGLFEQRCAERVAKQGDNCPRRQSNAKDEHQSHDDMDQDRLSCEPHLRYHRHRRLHSHPHPHVHPHPIHHHHHHQLSEDQVVGAISPDAAKQQGQHQHLHQETALVETGARHHHHHRHVPHQHQHHAMAAHPHNHPHVHHHPQHLGLQGPQHAKHPHHHHHHIHHHHLHIEKSPSSAPSAFHYVPKSAGLSLNPRLKVNATQVYISYLIQLDQMQRAQHLKRSSEKRKSSGDMVNELIESPTSQRPPHARTPSIEENGRSVQVVPHPEELADREREDRAYSPSMIGSPEDRKRRSSIKLDDADAMASMDKGSLAPMTVDPSSPISSRSRHSLGHHHPHPRSHPHSHHATQAQQSPHAHPHPHPSHGGHQHSAPVLPAHVHPAQHHHHIVPSTARLEKGPISAAAAAASAKANHSQTVHRHHALHHHHPHHHPYHPNHPNHQHHFHHHGHPGAHGHGHAHGHAYGHGHGHGHGYGHGHGHPYHGHGHMHHNHIYNHGNHLHSHGHGHSPSRQRSPTVDRIARDSATPPISRLPHVAQPIAHPSVPIPSASPNSTAASTTVVSGAATLVASESHHHGGEDTHAPSPSGNRHDRGGNVSPGHHGTAEFENDNGRHRLMTKPESVKDVAPENPPAQPSPPPTTTTTVTPILETAMNVD